MWRRRGGQDIQRIEGVVRRHRVAGPTGPVAEPAIRIGERTEIADTCFPIGRGAVQLRKRAHRRPRVRHIVHAADTRPGLVSEAPIRELTVPQPRHGFFRVFHLAAQGAHGLQAPPGVHRVPVAAIRRGRIVETAVGPTARHQIVDKRRREVIVRQPEQSPTREGGQFQAEDRIAVLLVLPRVNRRFRPAANEIAEGGHVLFEPEQTLNLLPLENAEVALQFLDAEGMMSADKFREFGLVRRIVLEQSVTADRGEGRREVGPGLIFPPGVSAIGAGQPGEVGQHGRPVAVVPAERRDREDDPQAGRGCRPQDRATIQDRGMGIRTRSLEVSC